MTVKNYISLFLIAMIIILSIVQKIIKTKHKNDPEFAMRMEEREREYKRKMQEEADLEQSLYTYDDEEEDYQDD